MKLSAHLVPVCGTARGVPAITAAAINGIATAVDSWQQAMLVKVLKHTPIVTGRLWSELMQSVFDATDRQMGFTDIVEYFKYVKANPDKKKQLIKVLGRASKSIFNRSLKTNLRRSGLAVSKDENLPHDFFKASTIARKLKLDVLLTQSEWEYGESVGWDLGDE